MWCPALMTARSRAHNPVFDLFQQVGTATGHIRLPATKIEHRIVHDNHEVVELGVLEGPVDPAHLLG